MASSSSSSHVAPNVVEFADVDVDRLTSLPDSLLHHILYFLPTKDAAATSMLSTYWQQIFPSVPNLELDFDDNEMAKEQFESFVNKVLHGYLANGGTQIRSMRIHCYKEHWPHIKTWIGAAARLQAESLDLKFTIRQPQVFCSELNKCSRLTNLKLNNSPIMVPESFCLPHLKFLEVQKMGLVKEETVINLLYGCPLLEEFIMIDCRVYGRILCIVVPTLKRLTLQDLMFFIGNTEEIYDFEIRLDASELEEICYFDYHVAPRYNTCDMPLLQKARVDIKPDAEQEKDDIVGYSINVAEFVVMCSLTRFLYLSGRTLQAIFYSARDLAKFPNLTHLAVEINVVCPRIWKLVTEIIASAPNLVTLDIEVGVMKYKECIKCDAELGEEIPGCFTSNLKKVSVSCFTGAEQEFILLSFFLENAKSLEKMVIDIDESELKPEEQPLIKEMILNLPNPSADCRVVVNAPAGDDGAN